MHHLFIPYTNLQTVLHQFRGGALGTIDLQAYCCCCCCNTIRRLTRTSRPGYTLDNIKSISLHMNFARLTLSCSFWCGLRSWRRLKLLFNGRRLKGKEPERTCLAGKDIIWIFLLALSLPPLLRHMYGRSFRIAPNPGRVTETWTMNATEVFAETHN